MKAEKYEEAYLKPCAMGMFHAVLLVFSGLFAALLLMSVL
jgi:hypothetical protein